MGLKDLAKNGIRKLSGLTVEEVEGNPDGYGMTPILTSVSLVLDSRAYRLTETTDDEFKFFNWSVERHENPSMIGRFISVDVFCDYKEYLHEGIDGKSEYLRIINADTGAVIIEIGIDQSAIDGPECCCHYIPNSIYGVSTASASPSALDLELISPELLDAMQEIENEKRGDEYGAWS